MNIVKTLAIGTRINIHNKDNLFTITKIQIGNNSSLLYLVCTLDDDCNYKEIWITPEEITSNHKEVSIISQCIK